MSDDATIPRPPAAETQAMAAPLDPRVGVVIAGKYRILQRIARGGMARIYKAEQQPLGRVVALKELITSRDKSESDPEFHQRFFLEASTLSKLSHPNTVRVFDYGQHEDAYYMVMEFVEGRTLAQVLRDEGTIDPLRALHFTIEIVRSLQEAHGLGIVHRDLKPSNVMLVDTLEGEAIKVLDFGIAKVMQDESQNITLNDRIVGSPRYMAPEQIRHGDIDQRTDIYALGVMLFEFLTGAPPYAGEKTLETLMAHLNAPIPSLRERSPHEIPPMLEEVVTACLAKKPSERPASAAILRDTLREVLLEIAETSTTGARMTAQGLVRRAIDRRDPQSGSHTRPLEAIDPSTALSQPTLNRPEPRTSKVGLLIGGTVLLGLLLGVAATAWFATREPPAAEVPVADATPPAPQEVTLTITSTPPGAEVWEGNRMHGVTPLDLPLASAGGQRQFELKLPGHAPFAVAQGASEAPVTLHADLTPVQAAPPPAPAPAPKAAPKQAAPKPKPKPKPDLDILIER